MLDALEDLSPKHRAVVVMYYYQDFSVAEISKALGCFRKTVRTRLHYARARLREILESRASPITGPSLSNPETHRNGRTAEPVPGPYIPAKVEVEPW